MVDELFGDEFLSVGGWRVTLAGLLRVLGTADDVEGELLRRGWSCWEVSEALVREVLLEHADRVRLAELEVVRDRPLGSFGGSGCFVLEVACLDGARRERGVLVLEVFPYDVFEHVVHQLRLVGEVEVVVEGAVLHADRLRVAEAGRLEVARSVDVFDG